MGSTSKNTQTASNAQNSSGTPTGSGVQPGYSQNATPSGTTSNDQDTAFSAGGVSGSIEPVCGGRGAAGKGRRAFLPTQVGYRPPRRFATMPARPSTTIRGGNPA